MECPNWTEPQLTGLSDPCNHALSLVSSFCGRPVQNTDSTHSLDPILFGEIRGPVMVFITAQTSRPSSDADVNDQGKLTFSLLSLKSWIDTLLPHVGMAGTLWDERMLPYRTT
jgi:hypothetical protein